MDHEFMKHKATTCLQYDKENNPGTGIRKVKTEPSKQKEASEEKVEEKLWISRLFSEDYHSDTLRKAPLGKASSE